MNNVVEYIWLATKDGVMHVRLRYGRRGYETPFCGAKSRGTEADTNVFCMTCRKGVRLFAHRVRIDASWSSAHGGRKGGSAQKSEQQVVKPKQ